MTILNFKDFLEKVNLKNKKLWMKVTYKEFLFILYIQEFQKYNPIKDL